MTDERRYADHKIDNSCITASCSAFLFLALIGIVLLLLPMDCGRARRASPKSLCISNLKQIGIGINMYMSDHDNKLPPVSGFGPELDNHTAIWGADGRIFNRQKHGPKYMPDFIKPYIRNDKVYICPDMEKPKDSIWKVPGGRVDFRKNGTSYIFNAWYRRDMKKRPPAGCVVIAGKEVENCKDPSSAPMVWDGISGFGQQAHGDMINVEFMDFHARSVTVSGSTSTYWAEQDVETWK